MATWYVAEPIAGVLDDVVYNRGLDATEIHELAQP